LYRSKRSARAIRLDNCPEFRTHRAEVLNAYVFESLEPVREISAE
jgi:hypothetical protein